MKGGPLEVIAGAHDKTLAIGNIEIQCYVLEDETRVLSQRGFMRALGRSESGLSGHDNSAHNLPPFLSQKNLNRFINNDLVARTTLVEFQPQRGRTAYGYPAKLLPKVCNVYLRARDAGALLPSQEKVAKQAEILIRGLAEVGIIALVDEATGYQKIREERALANILEKFIAKELHSWTKTFPYEFYQQIFRLKKWSGPDGINRPSVIGHYTNDFVYERLAPGVLEELKLRNPTLLNGTRKYRHHQWFTTDVGHPKLKEHLAGVVALMRAAPNWDAFKRSLQRAYPKKNTNFDLHFYESGNQ